METIYLDHLHNQAYLKPYQQKCITSETLIDPGNREALSLDGTWQLCPDQYDTCLRARWFAYKPPVTSPQDCDFEGWQETTVPSCWNTLTPKWEFYEGTMLYQRRFACTREAQKRYWLCFEGVANRAYLFLNGHYLGFHEGSSTPFSVEVTDFLEPANHLLLSVNNSRLATSVPSDNTDWFNYGGIYREVSLVALPAVFIKRWFVHLVDENTLSIEVECSDSVPVEVRCPELGLEETLSCEEGKATLIVPFTGTAWSVEDPVRYRFAFVADEDRVEDLIGLRLIKTEKTAMLLNGKELFLRGVCLHEDHPDFGRFVNENLLRRSLDEAKSLGCNCIRLSHYPHHRLMAKLADELGLLLWEEIAVYWGLAFAEQQTLASAQNQLSELIVRDRNRGSVIIWSVGNENPDTDDRLAFMSSLADLAHTLDPSRLVGAACLVNEAKLCIEDRLEEKLDVIGLNEYYGWYDGDWAKLETLLANSAKDKPVLVTEFGAGAKSGFHDAKEALFSEEKQASVYQRQFARILRTGYIQGTFAWILYDFRSPRRMNRYQMGYNRKGLLDERRRHHKLAYQVVQKQYENLKTLGR
nr:glycoside hydrolase family 2 TIM barrel-domain containing protein [uncultured Sphaerochaeta sp.]